MPLIKKASKKAFSHNVEAEMESGKPQDQSLAIAYSTQRASKKKMAYGGQVDRADGNPGLPQAKPDDHRLPQDEYMSNRMAEGGEVEEHYSSIADAILSKSRKSQDNGMVDINENAQESGQSPYDEDNHEAYMKELYDDDQLGPQPEDSNEKGDIFGSIKRKRR